MGSVAGMGSYCMVSSPAPPWPSLTGRAAVPPAGPVGLLPELAQLLIEGGLVLGWGESAIVLQLSFSLLNFVLYNHALRG